MIGAVSKANNNTVVSSDVKDDTSIGTILARMMQKQLAAIMMVLSSKRI